MTSVNAVADKQMREQKEKRNVACALKKIWYCLRFGRSSILSLPNT